MKALLWVYRRLGQMGCFAVGGFMLFAAFTNAADGGGEPFAMFAVGATVVGAGLALRWMHIWRTVNDPNYR